MVHQLARRGGLVEALGRRVHLLKMHRPYHESDPILSMAHNILAGGKCLEELELLRNDEQYLHALGADAIPAPTTAGDFRRRFSAGHIHLWQPLERPQRYEVKTAPRRRPANVKEQVVVRRQFRNPRLFSEFVSAAQSELEIGELETAVLSQNSWVRT